MLDDFLTIGKLSDLNLVRGLELRKYTVVNFFWLSKNDDWSSNAFFQDIGHNFLKTLVSRFAVNFLQLDVGLPLRQKVLTFELQNVVWPYLKDLSHNVGSDFWNCGTEKIDFGHISHLFQSVELSCRLAKTDGTLVQDKVSLINDQNIAVLAVIEVQITCHRNVFKNCFCKCLLHLVR